jgi:hypothetical protein
MVRGGIAAVLVASTLCACGDAAQDEAPPAPAKAVQGQTETGMTLRVEPFVAPAGDPQLARVEAWRVAMGYPAVDYHRVTADNGKGAMPDRGRVVRFARYASDLSAGRGIVSRFLCSTLEYEWLPVANGRTEQWNALRDRNCPQVGTISPGTQEVYYLVTDREFGTRRIRTMHVFGPQDSEFR